MQLLGLPLLVARRDGRVVTAYAAGAAVLAPAAAALLASVGRGPTFVLLPAR